MDSGDFRTSAHLEALATEVLCLKATLALILKSINQVDAGKVILRLESFINKVNDPNQAETLKLTLQQIKDAYLQ